MLVVDPDQRLNIQQVIADPWFTRDQPAPPQIDNEKKVSSGVADAVGGDGNDQKKQKKQKKVTKKRKRPYYKVPAKKQVKRQKMKKQGPPSCVKACRKYRDRELKAKGMTSAALRPTDKMVLRNRAKVSYTRFF